MKANGAVYDVAVDIGKVPGDVALYEQDLPLPGGAWAEGWHGTDTLTYTQLGVHSAMFTAQDPAPLGQKIIAELASANHVSIFGIGYTQQNGCHDVHFYKGNGQDGMLVIDPLSPKPHGLFFRFSTDSF